MRIVGEFPGNNRDENLRIFSLNFENNMNFGKDFEKTSYNFFLKF